MQLSRIIHEGTRVSNVNELTRFDPNSFLPLEPIPANTVGVVEKLGVMQTHDKTVIAVFRVSFEGHGIAVFNGNQICELNVIDNHREGEIW